MHWVAQVAKSSALEAAAFNALAVVASLAALFLFQWDFVAGFGLVLLLLSVVLMLVGGALDISTSRSARVAGRQLRALFGVRASESGAGDLTEEERRRAGNSAATYALTGVLLFVETGILAFGL